MRRDEANVNKKIELQPEKIHAKLTKSLCKTCCSLPVSNIRFSIYPTNGFSSACYSSPPLSPSSFIYPFTCYCMHKIMHVYIGFTVAILSPLAKSGPTKKQSWIPLSVLICFVFVHFYCNVFSIVFAFGHVHSCLFLVRCSFACSLAYTKSAYHFHRKGNFSHRATLWRGARGEQQTDSFSLRKCIL